MWKINTLRALLVQSNLWTGANCCIITMFSNDSAKDTMQLYLHLCRSKCWYVKRKNTTENPKKKNQCLAVTCPVNEIKVMMFYAARNGWLPDNQFIISLMIRILSIWINSQHLRQIITLLSFWDILAAPLGNLQHWQNMTKSGPARLKHINCNEKSLSRMLSELASALLLHSRTPIIRSVSKCVYWWTLTSVPWSMIEARSSWRQDTKHSFSALQHRD